MGDHSLIDPEEVVDFTQKMRDLGVEEFTWGDLRVKFMVVGGVVEVPGRDVVGEVSRMLHKGVIEEGEAEDLVEYHTDEEKLAAQTEELRKLKEELYRSAG